MDPYSYPIHLAIDTENIVSTILYAKWNQINPGIIKILKELHKNSYIDDSINVITRYVSASLQRLDDYKSNDQITIHYILYLHTYLD